MNRLLWVVALTTSAAPAVLAQSMPATPAMAKKAPANIGIEPYRSAFEGFRPWNDEAAQDWRRVNNEMEQLGGHIGHLRAPPSADKPAGTKGEQMMPGMPMHGGPARKADRAAPDSPLMREMPMQGGALPGKAPEKKQ